MSAFAFLLPFVLAFGVLVRLGHVDLGRGLQLSGILIVGVCAVFLVGGGQIGVSPRVIVVTDGPSPPGDQRLAEVLRRLQPGGGFPYRTIALTPDGKRDPGWHWFDGIVVTGSSATAVTPDEALLRALEAFRKLTWGAWLDDLVRLRQRRLVVVVSDVEMWRRWQLDTAKLAREALREGVTIDVVHIQPAPASAILEIDSDTDPIPANALASEQRFAVQLRLRAPILTDPALTGRLVPVVLQCTINGEPRTGPTPPDPDPHRVPLDPRPALHLAERRDARITGAGTIEVTLSHRQLRGKNNDAPWSFPAGFHLAEAEMTVHLDGGAITARGAAYLRVATLDVILVAGQANRFSAVDEGQHDKVLRTELEDLKRYDRRWPPTVGSYTVVAESELQQALAQAPLLLVLHDVSDAVWKAHSLALQQYVARGGHLLVCGLPSPPPADAWLPAYATAGHQYDRRPRLTFVLDQSRLGHLPEYLALKGPHGYSVAGREIRRLGHGGATQAEVIRRLSGNLAAIPGMDAPLPADLIGPVDLRGPGGRLPRQLTLQAHNLFLRTALFRLPDGKELAETTGRMLAESSIHHRLKLLDQQYTTDREQLLNERRKAASSTAAVVAEFGWNEVVVLFVYDVAQSADSVTTLQKVLRQGWVVAPVLIKTPFTLEARGVGAANSLEPAEVFRRARVDLVQPRADLVRPANSSSLFTDAEAARRLVWDGKAVIDLSKGPDGVAAQADAVAKQLSTMLADRLHARGDFAYRHREGRFFDERSGGRYPLNDIPSSIPVTDRWAAPLIFQQLQPTGQPYFVTFGSVAGAGMLAAERRPLAVGGPFGRGSILCLGYSPFEGAARLKPAVIGGRWPDLMVNRVFRSGTDEFDRWGIQRVLDFAALVAELEPPPSDRPRVLRAVPEEPPGRVRFEVLLRLRPGAAPPDLAVTLGTHRAEARLTLVDLDTRRDRAIYELLPSTLHAALTGLPPAGRVVKGSLDGSAVSLIAPSGGETPDLHGLAAVGILAHYSGGGEYDHDRPEAIPPPRMGLRVPAGIAMAAAMAGVWWLRVGRRLRLWRTQRQQVAAERGVAASFDEGAVRAAGEALGRPQSYLRVGAFAGYRPFEPGDRLQNAVLEDLIFMLVPRQWPNTEHPAVRPTIPRVAQRIDERLHRLHLVVQLGESLRLPRYRGQLPPKMAAAARVAGLLAAEALRRQAEVIVHPLGLRHPVAPLVQVGGSGKEVYAWLLEAASRPGRWAAEPVAACEEPGSVVYISDFLAEQAADVLAWAARAEADVGPVGAVLVYDPAEFHYLDVGCVKKETRWSWLPGIDVWCDRSEWLPTDLQQVHRSFTNRLEDAFNHQGLGGLTVISSHWSDADFVEAFRAGRLMEVLR